MRAQGQALTGQAASRQRAPEEPGPGEVTAAVDATLAAFLAERVADLRTLDPALGPVGQAVEGLVNAGGKRLRPAFVYWGYRATGAAHDPAVYDPAAAVELLHTFALIHDDIMDRSVERRGSPAVHTALAAAHATEQLAGDGDWFGVGGGILAGDLAFVWADWLFDEADLDPVALARARRVFTTLRVEVMAGQYLDLRLAGHRSASEADARRVALLKSGRYTVTRPLELGAALGGADAARTAALGVYGDALGLAFQLRDDVLGMFGDPSATGKGAIEDLREGKRTVLVLRALELADPAGRRLLEAALGTPDLDEDDAARARQVIVDSGALAAVEALLAEEHDTARGALTAVPEPARSALADLADLAVRRDT